MKKRLNKIKSHVIAHKTISVVVLIIIISISYWSYKKITDTSGDIRYITAKVQRGTIISSVSGSGQVSASNQIDIKAKVSGEVECTSKRVHAAACIWITVCKRCNFV